MGSMLLYGVIFCLILWWLIRYYLRPWWQQKSSAKFNSDTTTPYPDNSLQSARPDTLQAEKNIDSSGSEPHLTALESNLDNESLPATPKSDSTHGGSSGATSHAENCDVLVAEEIDLNATTDLQGQLEVLHQEKEKNHDAVRGLSNRYLRSSQPRARTGADKSTDKEDAEQESADSRSESEDELHEHIVVLEKQIDENNSDITMLCTELKEARRYEARFNENDKRLAEQQTELLRQEDELRDLQSRNNKLGNIESQLKLKNNEIAELKSEALRSAALETDLRGKNQAIHQLTLKADKVSQLEALVATREDELSQLHARQNDAASLVARVQELEREHLDAENEMISLLATRDSEISNLQSQLAESDRLQQSLTEKDQELARLRRVESELRQSQSRIEALGQSLSDAESDSAANQQNDLELRRLRSELQSVTQERDRSSREIGSLEDRVQRQQQKIDASNALSQRVQELDKLESGIHNRDRQISELQQRLADLLKSSGQTPETATINTAQVQVDATVSSQAQSHPVQPLFTAPAEKDNLKLIKGIGPVLEKTLNSLGVTSFKQLAEFNQSEIDLVSNAIDTFPGRIERDDWVGGAKEQFQKKNASKIEA